MCPLRVILLFLSAILAGYFAIKTVRAQGESSIILDGSIDDEPLEKKAIEQSGFLTKVSTGVSSLFSVTIDMLSGRYLYQTLKGQARIVAVPDH